MESNLNFKDFAPRDLQLSDLKFLRRWTCDAIPDEDLMKRVTYVHQEILSRIHVYRCISSFSYLNPRAPKEPIYGEILEMARSLGPDFRMLDVGTCFGQETRGFIADGVPPECIVATDLHDVYWEAGRRLFGENSTFSVDKVRTIFGDLTFPMAPASADGDDAFSSLADTFHCVMCLAILHVLSKKQSENLLRRLCGMMKEGGVLFGYAVGAVGAQEWAHTPNSSTERRWLYDVSTLQETMAECGFRKVEVKAREMGGSHEIDDVEKVYLAFVARK